MAQPPGPGRRARDAGSLPTFLALSPNINDFRRFADGGSDGNWYVGFNNAWIVRLPQAPGGGFVRAFIGAKLGRAKTRPLAGRPWERRSVPGKIYVSISRTPAFSSEESFFLADGEDIPAEPDPNVYAHGMGQAQWFWTEVPIGDVSSSEPNFVIIWSPTDTYTSNLNSPILAALETSDEASLGGTHAWLNRSIRGVPPRKASGALETPINNLYPAIAIKLVPANHASVGVLRCSAEPLRKNIVFRFSVAAEDAEEAWLEASNDQLDWERVSGFIRQPPYMITIPRDAVLSKGPYLRAAASDLLGNKGACRPVLISNEPR